MKLLLRPAIRSDVDAMAAMAHAKRLQYAEWQPVFHKPAENAKVDHAKFLEDLLHRDNTLVLVADEAGTVKGFAFGRFVPPPPVYAPGGSICLIDDFCVADESLWPSIGSLLLSSMKERAKAQGAVLSTVVCGPNDQLKRDMLLSAGMSVASEWFVG